MPLEAAEEVEVGHGGEGDILIWVAEDDEVDDAAASGLAAPVGTVSMSVTGADDVPVAVLL